MKETREKKEIFDVGEKGQTSKPVSREFLVTPAPRVGEVDVSKESMFDRGKDLTQFQRNTQNVFISPDRYKSVNQIRRNEIFDGDRNIKPLSKDRR